MATHRAHSVLKEENITYRESRAEDRDGISSLNSSFRTNTVLCVNIASDGLVSQSKKPRIIHYLF